MLSPQLQTKMHLMEMAIFPVWQKSDAKKKEKIIKDLARRQCDMIMEEIQCQSQSKN